MNHFIEDEFPLQQTQSLRYDLLNALTDEDLAYKLPGDNPTLGELCQELGNIEQAYIQSFKTLTFDWAAASSDPAMATSTERLKAWYQTLDEEFEAVIRTFSDEDLKNKQIDRGNDFIVSADDQFRIFHEAVLMFYAKASVYTKALQKPMNDQWIAWIG